MVLGNTFFSRRNASWQRFAYLISLISGFVDATLANTNYQKILENNLRKKLIDNQTNFSPVTAILVNRLEQAIENRRNRFKGLFKLNLLSVWQKICDHEYKNATQALANDAKANQEIRAYIEIFEHKKV